MSVGQRKYLSPGRESNPWPHVHWDGALSTEPRELVESEAIKLSPCMTGVQHTARNSNVEVVVVKDNKINGGEF